VPPGATHEDGTRRVLHHGRPSLRARLVQPVVVKQGSIFLLCTDVGDVAPGTDQGLYFHDMRYLSGEVLTIEGAPPVPLLANAGENGRAVFQLTNTDLKDADGRLRCRKETLGVRREKRLDEAYDQEIVVQNHAAERAEVRLALRYEADFADMFAIRGAAHGERGELHAPRWRGRTLLFRYDGADGHRRELRLRFSRQPDERGGGELLYRLGLGGQERWRLTVHGELRDAPAEGRNEAGGELEAKPGKKGKTGPAQIRWAHEGRLGPGMGVTTDNALFNQVLARSFMDLHMLAMRVKGQTFFAAGVPWYVALFGRDSLVTALQMLAYEPDVAENTLRVLAARQGTKVDDWRDEQPGKILHELRVDEMANLGEIPQTPYYGSVDATPLFLAVLGAHAVWTGRLDLFRELRGPVEAALGWIDRYGDSDGDGFVDYATRSEKGLRNQGWKDSGNGVVRQDGALAEPPIALPEVQGDVYLAWTLIADMYRRDGDDARADELLDKARRLRAAFTRAFWVEEERYYAFCLEQGGRPVASVASNPAHALWTGIVDQARAGAVVARVLKEDMFSGWGVRTLSAAHPAYNPVDYQVGSVWPHDNAFVVAGMHRCGFVDEANRVFAAIVGAAERFEHFRLPEVFAGYDLAYAAAPVRYPVACNPQAWAAGAVPHMLQSVLGLRPDGFGRRLLIHRPSLPPFLNRVEVRGLRVGDAAVDLRYERSGAATLVAVAGRKGELTVVVEY
jgi:glycogen debranching enzyme